MNIKQIKQRLNLTDTDLAEIFGYASVHSYRNAARKKTLEKGVEKIATLLTKDPPPQRRRHWSHNLKEAGGAILLHARWQENRLRDIADLREQIVDLENEYAEAEVLITNLIINPDPSKGWTAEEVERAKRGEEVV